MKPTKLATLAVISLCICLLVACGGGSEPAKDASAPPKPADSGNKDGGEAGPRADQPRVFVIEIDEENKDALPARLEEHDDDHDTVPPFQILYDQLVIHRDKPTADALGEQALTVEPAGTPLSKCKVFVVHAVRHGGKGRIGIDARYYGFAAMPAAVATPAKVVADRVEHDPSAGPLMQAMMDIRLFPENVKQIDIRDAGDGKVTVAVGGEAKTLAAGESIVLWSLSKHIDVNSKPLTSDSVTRSDDLFDPAPPRAPGPRQVIVDAVTFGKVEFGTRVKVTFHGLFPLTTTPPQPKLED